MFKFNITILNLKLKFMRKCFYELSFQTNHNTTYHFEPIDVYVPTVIIGTYISIIKIIIV